MKSSTIVRLLLAASLTPAFFSCTKELAKPVGAISQTLPSVNGMVQTPYGLLPASRVHAVDNHTVAKMVGGRLQLVDMNTGRLVEDLGVPSVSDLAVKDPFAFARSLNGSTTSGDVNVTLGTNPTFGSTGASGTDLGSYYTSASLSGIQSLSTKWLVPNFPLDTVNPVTIFYWNALDGGALQPVLQYDQGYGNAYTIANWYFTDGNYFHGTFIPVTPGTQLQGVITFVSNPNDTTWNYKESFTG